MQKAKSQKQKAKVLVCFHLSSFVDQEFSRKLLILILPFKFQSNHQLLASTHKREETKLSPLFVMKNRTAASLLIPTSYWPLQNPRIPTQGKIKIKVMIHELNLFQQWLVGPMRWKVTSNSQFTQETLCNTSDRGNLKPK